MTDHYDMVAAEYYDQGLHPTCANLRAASRSLLAPQLTKGWMSEGLILEVGAGQSLVSEILCELGASLLNLVLLDSSMNMLRHSLLLRGLCRGMLVGDVSNLPFASNSLARIVSVLGDPYNTEAFWREARRVLRPGGTVAFTTPAFEWAVAFRELCERNVAIFETCHGSVRVPSLVVSHDEQRTLFAKAGLRVVHHSQLSVTALSTPISPKLLPRGLRGPVVTCYVVEPDNSLPPHSPTGP